MFEYTKFNNLDDLLRSTYEYIQSNGFNIEGKRGNIKEVLNYAVTLTNPRSRVSNSLDRRLVKSKFAEFAWYLSNDADKEYINPYIDAYNQEEAENNKILGGYGPRIFNENDNGISQFDRIIEQINQRQKTKQAYLVVSDSFDYKVRVEKHSSPPCTIGLHFIVRENKLNLTVYMRSNDAYFGLPHDLFCFTMLQELVALKVNIPVGTYSHVCTSMHIYKTHYERVSEYLKEGYFENVAMPHFDNFDKPTLRTVVKSFDTRQKDVDISALSSYWHDYVLFSNRFNEDIERGNWLEKFKTKEIRNIAKSSISK